MRDSVWRAAAGAPRQFGSLTIGDETGGALLLRCKVRGPSSTVLASLVTVMVSSLLSALLPIKVITIVAVCGLPKPLW
jgi:hypothetical protein